MPADVPPSLVRVADLLRCPHCGLQLSPTTGALICARGHRHDVAREGYVSLLDGPVGRAAGDDAGMVAARVETERAGHFEPLTAAIVDAIPTQVREASAVVLDSGAGTGKLQAEVLRECGEEALGIAIDVSRPACRRAARAHRSLAVGRADTWSKFPLGDDTVDLALNAFAPRNGCELARVLRQTGTLLVATPTSEHLRELRDLHTLSIHPDKPAQLRRRLGPWFREVATQAIHWRLALTTADAANLLLMGPTVGHLRPGALDRLAESPEPVLVSAAVELRTFRPN